MERSAGADDHDKVLHRLQREAESDQSEAERRQVALRKVLDVVLEKRAHQPNHEADQCHDGADREADCSRSS